MFTSNESIYYLCLAQLPVFFTYVYYICMCCLLVYAHLHKGNISVYMQRQSSKECGEMHRVRVIFPLKVYWSMCYM